MGSTITPDQRFWIKWDTAVAVEILEDRGVLPTPEAIRAVLLEDGEDPTVTLERIRIGMAALIDTLSRPAQHGTAEQITRQVRTVKRLTELLQATPTGNPAAPSSDNAARGKG